MKAIDAIMRVLEDEDSELESLPVFSLRQPGVVPIPTANIATDLKERVEIQRGSRAFIVGYDGPNLSADNYPWIEMLEEWLKKGCEITYLLIKPTERATNALLSLVPSEAAGKLSVYTVSEPSKDSGSAAEFINQWRTFHFGIFEEPRQLWVEGCHEPGVTVAKDCFFFPKGVADKPGLLDVLKSRFEFVIKTCGVKLA